MPRTASRSRFRSQQDVLIIVIGPVACTQAKTQRRMRVTVERTSGRQSRIELPGRQIPSGRRQQDNRYDANTQDGQAQTRPSHPHRIRHPANAATSPSFEWVPGSAVKQRREADLARALVNRHRQTSHQAWARTPRRGCTAANARSRSGRRRVNARGPTSAMPYAASTMTGSTQA
jgi:hypothetical protein